ncbi:unnamed protein product [Urochloa humidicola]
MQGGRRAKIRRELPPQIVPVALLLLADASASTSAAASRSLVDVATQRPPLPVPMRGGIAEEEPATSHRYLIPVTH